MCRQGGMRRQGVMCGQEMGRRNVSSGHVCAVRNVSSQCVVSVTAKSDTQDAGALHIYIYMVYPLRFLLNCFLLAVFRAFFGRVPWMFFLGVPVVMLLMYKCLLATNLHSTSYQ